MTCLSETTVVFNHFIDDLRTKTNITPSINPIFFLMCGIYMCVHLHACIHTWEYMCACKRGQCCVFLNLSLPYYVRKGLSLTLKLIDSPRLLFNGFWVFTWLHLHFNLPAFLLPSAEVQMQVPIPGVYPVSAVVLTWQIVYQLSHLSNPYIRLFLIRICSSTISINTISCFIKWKWRDFERREWDSGYYNQLVRSVPSGAGKERQNSSITPESCVYMCDCLVNRQALQGKAEVLN